jgi:cardiolipin synthase
MLRLATGIGPPVLTIVHLVLALSVTGHVLLHRREASSSIAWIGLAWLSPLLGCVLYLLLGINRVRRRAATLRGRGRERESAALPHAVVRDDHLAQLERAGRQITARALLGGNGIAILRSGDEAYPQMLGAIAAARVSVRLSTYLFRADSIGSAFIDALQAAVARGVAVHVLVDGIGSGYFRSPAFRRLRRAGVPAARFLHSPLPWRMPFLNLRNHRKLLCVDGCTAFTGGLNIGDENLARQHPSRRVIDTHFRLDGPIVTQLDNAFIDDWYFATGEQLPSSSRSPTTEKGGDSDTRAVTSGPDQDLDKLELLILEAIGCARASIRIMTPYFLPDDRVMTALALASIRGVEVDLILPERSNHPALDWAARAHVAPLLAAGCRIWTHQPPFDHSKLLTVDGLWCLIGSANWDMRSFRLNFELNLEIYNPDLIREIDAMLVRQRHHRITAEDLAARSVPIVLRDSATRLLLPYL